MTVFNMDFTGIEKLSFVDWEGKICTTLFTSGCNFRCPFCHNSHLVLGGLNNPQIPFEEILNFLKSRVGLVEAVVVSGGEPTLMKDLTEKIKAIKSLGFAVKLDTNGSNFNVLKELTQSKLIDYVAMDIKNSFEKYPLTCGLKNMNLEDIKKSISYLKENHIPYEFRMTVIKEFHKLEDMDAIGKIIEGTEKFYLQKFKDSGTCIEQNLNPVPENEIEEYVKVLKKYTKEVILRGYN